MHFFGTMILDIRFCIFLSKKVPCQALVLFFPTFSTRFVFFFSISKMLFSYVNELEMSEECLVLYLTCYLNVQ